MVEVRGARMRLADGDNKTLAVFVNKASTQ
jgi:hypothetical protein